MKRIPPQVLLKVERMKDPAKHDYSRDAWVYESRLDTIEDSYEVAIIE